MKTLTLTESGSIYDIGTESGRDIKFPRNAKFAVVLAAYYGGQGYTTHRTATAAIREARKMSRMNYSYEIIDVEGSRYAVELANWQHLDDWLSPYDRQLKNFGEKNG